jgi:soluble cytochrome b562
VAEPVKKTRADFPSEMSTAFSKVRVWSSIPIVTTSLAVSFLSYSLLGALSLIPSKVSVLMAAAFMASWFGIITWFGWRLLRNWRDAGVSIRQLEKKYPNLRNDISTLHEWYERDRESPLGLSNDLYFGLERHIQQRLGELPLKQELSIPAGLREQKRGIAVLIALLLCALAVGSPREIVHRFRSTLYARGPEAGWLSQASPLKVGSVRVTVSPPAYSELPREENISWTGQILEVLKGSQLALSFQSDLKLKSSGLILPGGEFLPAQSDDGIHFEVRFTARNEGKIGFRGIDERGTQRQDPVGRDLKVNSDQPPNVELLRPESDLDVTPDSQVEFSYRVTDDFGLSEVLLHLEGAGVNVDIPLAKSADRRLESTYRLSLSKVPIGAETKIIDAQLFATDNDQVSGSKKGSSHKILLKLKSAEEERTERIESLGEIQLVLVELLGDLLEIGKGAPNEAKHLDRLRAYLVGLKGSGKNDRRLRQLRTTIVRRLEEILESPQVEPIESLILQLDQLTSREHLEHLWSTAKSAERTVDRLTESLENLKGVEGKEELERMLHEMERTAQDLSKALSRLSEKAAPEFVNPEAFEGQDLKSLDSAMQKIQKLIDEGKIEEAKKALEEELKRLKSMASQFAQGSKKMAGEANPALKKEFETMTNELKSIHDSQQKLMDDTMRNRNEIEEKNAMGKQPPAALVEKIKALQRSLDLAVNETAKERSEPWRSVSGRTLRRGRLSAGDIEKNVLRNRIREAYERSTALVFQLESLLKTADNLRGIFDRSHPPELKGKPLFGHPAVKASSTLAIEVQKELEKLQQTPEQRSLSESDQKKLEGLRKRQAELEKRTDDLKQSFDRFNQQHRIMEAAPTDPLPKASQSMQNAGGKLKAGDPSGAVPDQRDAMESLQEMKDNLQSAGRDALPSGFGEDEMMPNPDEGGSSGGFRNESVLLPKDNREKSAAEWRKKLMDAMKQKPPEGYEDVTKKYFRELMK